MAPSSVIKEMERELRGMEALLERAFLGTDWSKIPADRPIFYGVSVEVGKDGIPHLREFGNLRPPDILGLEAPREPLVSLVEDPKTDRVHVTAEMPGVEKEDIILRVMHDGIRIRAHAADRRYHAALDLTPGLDPASARATYRNGVLDVTLERRASPGPAQDVRID